MSLRRVQRGLAALALGVLLSGCGDNSKVKALPADELEYELFSSTVALDPGTMADLMAQDPDGTLHFSGTPAQLAAIEPYQVILGPPNARAPYGLLRVVRAVDSDAEGLVLETVDAPLELAFRKLHVSFTRRIDSLAKAARGGWTEGARRTLASGSWSDTLPIETPPANGDGNISSDDDQVAGKGSVGGSFEYLFGIDVDWGDVFDLPNAIKDCLGEIFSGGGCSIVDLLPELKAGYHVAAEARAELDLAGVSYLPYEMPFAFDPVKLEPFDIQGILWFFPSVEVKGQISGQASSQFHLASRAHAGFELGVEFSSKHGATDPVPASWHDFEAPSADATLTARTRIDVTPELHLWLYGITGPFAGVTPWAALSANHDDEPCWHLDAGVDGSVGIQVQVSVPGIDTLVSFPGWGFPFPIVPSSEVLSGKCAPLAGGEVPKTPQGGAPTEAAFADPTFEPWAKVYDGAVVSHPYEWPGAQVEWTELTPTFDGRFLLTGSNTDTLLKLDPDGALVWAKRYAPPKPFNETIELTHLLPSRVVNTADAASLVVFHPFTLIKMDPAGTPLWVRHFELPHSEEVYRFTAAAAAPDNGFYVLGNTSDNVTLKTNGDALLARLDARGAVVWAQRLGSASLGERGQLLIPFEGGVVAAGSTYDPDGVHWRAFVLRFDDAGELVWSKRVEAPECTATTREGSTFLSSGLVTRNGELVLAGTVGRAPDATLVLKITPEGSLGWFASNVAPSPHLGPMVNAIVELPTSGYLAAGTFNYWATGSVENDEAWLGALDGTGRLQWMKGFGGDQLLNQIPYHDENYPALSLTRDGGAVLAAFTDSLVPDRRGLIALKVPAKNGVLSFPAGSAAHTLDLPYAPNPRYCVSLSDASVPAEAFEFVPASLTVSVEDAAVEVSDIAP